MRMALLVAAVMVSGRVWAGFVLTAENDYFQPYSRQSDDNYSHGTEFMWTEPRDDSAGGPFRESWGLRSRMYTPKTIESPLPPPRDMRPWCGMTTAFYERWDGGRLLGRSEAVRFGVDLGVVGPWAGCEWMQTEVHKLIGSTIPMGWSNQMPNEVAINLYEDRWARLLSGGSRGKWSWSLDAKYGGVLGTTFIQAGLGPELRAGWNMPDTPVDQMIVPKLDRGGSTFFMGVTAGASGWWQPHNSTLSGSFFYGRGPRDEKERPLEPLVGEWRLGATAGWRDFAATYLLAARSKEFEGQDKAMDWGMVSLAFGRAF